MNDQEEDEEEVEAREEIITSTLKKFDPANTTAFFSVLR